MTTTTAIKDMLAWCVAHPNKFRYSESYPARMNPETSGQTDCSGFVRYLYLKFAGLNIGTYTGDECKHGVLVTNARSAVKLAQGMLPGDLIFYRWENRALGSNPWDHVNMYIGGGKVQSHGGPDAGPDVESLAANVDNAVAVEVRRYIKAPTVSKPVPAPPTNPNPMHKHPVPAMIAKGNGYYFGLKTGPDKSLGGAHAVEQPYIKLIQEFLNEHQKAGLKVDGIFGPTTAAAVKVFQQHSMPGTQFLGQVWYDDWLKMASF